MTRKTFVSLFALGFLAYPSLNAAQQAGGSKRLILISVDGLKSQTLHRADQIGVNIPNLKEFRDNGALAQGLRGVFPTVTYPSHTTMVTGRDPAEHGIIANQLFDPENRMNGAWFWYTEGIRVPTLWDAAKAAGLTTAAVSWPVTVGAAIDYNFPEYRELHTENDVMLQRALNSPALMAEFEKEYGKLKAGRQDDRTRTAQAKFLIRTKKPHLLLLHLIDLDHEQHDFGPESKEALHALEVIDQCIGELRAEVKRAGLEQETRWIIISDHGFFPVHRAFHGKALLSSLGLAAPPDNPSGWKVAAHSNGGSIAFVARNPNDHESQALVVGALKTLSGQAQWGIQRVLEKEELAKWKAYPHAFVAVSLAPGFTAGSNATGPWVTDTKTRGMHGYLPGPEELDATFVAFGPGVPRLRLPRADLRDVARTAAALLGITIPTASGKDLIAAGAAAR